MRLNRHFPSAVLYGPLKYGGMEFPNAHTLQTTVQVKYLLKQLRWDKSVANDIIVTLDSIQLNAGLSSPILEDVSQPITYLGHSYFLSLRQRLAELQASFWIEEVWRPKPQREGDQFLMDYFTRIPGITTADLRKANAVRLYLRVLTISDLADPTGRFIPDGMLTGDWQAGSDIYWPHQVNPPQNFGRSSVDAFGSPFARGHHLTNLRNREWTSIHLSDFGCQYLDIRGLMYAGPKIKCTGEPTRQLRDWHQHTILDSTFLNPRSTLSL
jgi:hypothetical protein